MDIYEQGSVFEKYKLFIFDFDGVIINSIPLMEASFDYARTQLGLHVVFSEFLKRQGLPIDRIIDQMKLPAAFKRLYLDYSTENMAQIGLYPKVHEVLRFLQDKAKIISLYTGKDLVRTRMISEQFNISQYFDFTLTGCADIPGKPNGDGIALLLQLFKQKKSSSIMIGDSVNDYISARQAGIDCAGVNIVQKESISCKPKYYLQKINDIVEGWA